jgi:two-component system invasion response regulator UvrY
LLACQELTLATFAAFLQRVEHLSLLGQATTPAQAQSAIDAQTPTLLLIDVDRADGPDLTVVSQLRQLYPTLPMAVATLFVSISFFHALVAHHVQAYFTKDLSPQLFLHGLETVALGGNFFSPTVTAHLPLSTNVQAATSVLAQLTLREQEVFHLLRQGASFRTIAQQLHLSEQTVRNYASTLYEKLGVSSKGELVARYAQSAKT